MGRFNEGEYKQGVEHRHGVKTLSGSRYEGMWADGKCLKSVKN